MTSLKKKNDKRFSYVIRGLIYIAVGVSFGLAEHISSVLFDSPCDVPEGSNAALVTRRAYTYLTTFDRRKPENLSTSVVILRDDSEPKEVMSAFCVHREFVRKLVEEIQAHDPAGIVVDNYISADPCPIDHDFDVTLLNATVPIVLGLHTLKKDEIERLLRRPLAPAELESFSRACQALFDNRELPHGTSRVRRGLLRLNADTRKLPLSWPVFSDPNHLSSDEQPVILTTLSAEAAATLPKHRVPMLDAHPFTSFMPKDQIETTAGVQALCASNRPGDNWRTCPSPGKTFDDRFRHKIVLIGDDNDDELTPTPAGTMPGVYVHANDIEALTYDRYFKPVSRNWQIALGVALLLFIEFAYIVPVWLGQRNPSSIFHRMRFLVPVVGLALSFAGTAVLWLTSVLLAILTGTLAVFWAPGAVALVLRFGEGLREFIMEKT